jgi:hypothetical protein
MRLEIFDSLDAIGAADWDALHDGRNPTLRYAFLDALEQSGCVGSKNGDGYGWYPRHFALYSGDENQRGELIAACPAYLKSNNYGEFVFDWAWAEAYEQRGMAYYPKLVVGVPYTPASGPRLLIRPDFEPLEQAEIARLFSAAVRDFCAQNKLSGVHWLFAPDEQIKWLESDGLVRRRGSQYHWHNHGYQSFDDFLAALSSRKRKAIRRERARVVEQNVQVEMLPGSALSKADWHQVHRYYADIYDRKWGVPTLNADFFCRIGEQMGDALQVVFAEHEGQRAACAFFLRGADTLYGRFWGCDAQFHSLHFEACYYQGIDYCIREGLTTFEPGAGGEHKLSRGFLPTPTWSAHWLADEKFHIAIANYCAEEARHLQAQEPEWDKLSPYRKAE